MVLADLGRKLNAALSSLNRAPVVDEKVGTGPFWYIKAVNILTIINQVLDATLKEITSALLESDVNVKLVSSLRQKVKANVKAAFESSDKTKDTNRRNVIQKVEQSQCRQHIRSTSS
jgi:signal recognition particle subunit SRP54